MKILRLAVTFLSVGSVLGQALPSSEFDDLMPPPDRPPLRAPADWNWQPTARDEISTTWEATEYITDAHGVSSTIPHRYTEIGSGLNYFDETVGAYIPSHDLIELTADGGAAAVHGPAKLFLKANLNSADAVTLVTKKRRTFSTRPLGIFWYDAQSGASQLVAPVRDCVGELLPPNQVVWKGAFGPLADLRVTYTKSGIESDLILLQRPALPVGWDSATARLELWHDWTVPGEPSISTRSLRVANHSDLRDGAADTEVTDEVLDFGDLWFPTGVAFPTAATAPADPKEARKVTVPMLTPDTEPVAKTWLATTTKTILIEALNWQRVLPKLLVHCNG